MRHPLQTTLTRLLLLAACWWGAATASVVAAPPKKDAPAAKNAAPEKKFLRIQHDEDGEPLALQTAVLSYRPADKKNPGLTIDLIGAVHVGEKEYYRQLNKLFESYDVLPYELVAPEGTRIPKGGGGKKPRHFVGAMQVGMKDMLGLEFQLEQIDYTRKNFVHADMSPKEFSKSMKDRGESMWATFFRMMGYGLARQAKGGGSSDVELLAALFARDRAFRLKRIMAKQMEDLEGATAAIEGKKGSTLIGQRNKKAFAVLAEQIKAGKKRIGVFYGAGHLPDMEKRLLNEFGMKQTRHRWMTAWSLTRNKAAGK